MKILAEVLSGTSVSSLIKAKGSKKNRLITLPDQATIRQALTTYIEQDISAIPITGPNHFGEFLGMLNIVDVLRFIMKGSPESFYKLDIPKLLNQPIREIIRECGIKRVKIIKEQLSLMQLLFEHWGSINCFNQDQIDAKHLLVNCGKGRFEVITPTDLLRYIMFMSSESGYLRNKRAIEIECSFKIAYDEQHSYEQKMVGMDEDAWMAFRRLLENGPFYVLAVVDPQTGRLLANLSVIDFLPSCLTLKSSASASEKSISLEEAISMLRRPGLSLYTFLRTTRLLAVKSDFEPVCVQPHFTLADIIEKMAKMQIHQLWRVSQDRVQSPIGIIGICDVIAHFCGIFEPFYKTENYLDRGFK